MITAASWIEISANLPEAPVNDIIVNYPNNQAIYVATDVGVYVTFDGGNEWQPLGDNLPNVVVTDLTLHKPTNKLIAATYGRSMYAYDLEQDPTTAMNEISVSEKIVLYPNPFSESLNITFETAITSDFLFVRDQSGRLIARITPADKHSANWNGLNGSGEEVSAGIYLVSGETVSGPFVKKIVKQ